MPNATGISPYITTQLSRDVRKKRKYKKKKSKDLNKVVSSKKTGNLAITCMNTKILRRTKD